MNSARTMPCVLVLPPRSNPPGFHSSRICLPKLSMMESPTPLHPDRPFLGDLEAFVGTLAVDQRRSHACNWITQERIEQRAIERIEAALQMHKEVEVSLNQFKNAEPVLASAADDSCWSQGREWRNDPVR